MLSPLQPSYDSYSSKGTSHLEPCEYLQLSSTLCKPLQGPMSAQDYKKCKPHSYTTLDNLQRWDRACQPLQTAPTALTLNLNSAPAALAATDRAVGEGTTLRNLSISRVLAGVPGAVNPQRLPAKYTVTLLISTVFLDRCKHQTGSLILVVSIALLHF